MDKNFIGIDLFSGAGGMSIGAQLAGINVQLAIEYNLHAASTYKHNHKHTKVIAEDIRLIDTSSISIKQPFILFGGPPCQGFSSSNTKTRTNTNPNNSLFEHYLRFVSDLNPKWIVFENVSGFSNYDKGRTVRELEIRLNKLGYKVYSNILWASNFNVPQHRNRFFLVGTIENIKYTFPKAQNKKITVKEALYDLPNLSNGDSFYQLPYKESIENEYVENMRYNSEYSLQNYISRNKEYVIERYKHIKPGQNWESIPLDMMSNYSNIKNTHSGVYKRLHPDEPSIVISNYRKNMLIHPYENRGLSVREAARLQSFPDQYLFKGGLMEIQQQIGNAVPPLLAKEVFLSITNLY